MKIQRKENSFGRLTGEYLTLERGFYLSKVEKEIREMRDWAILYSVDSTWHSLLIDDQEIVKVVIVGHTWFQKH